MPRRPRRILRKLLFGFATLVAVSFIVVHVRSYSVTEEWFIIYRGSGSEHLECWRGRLIYRHGGPEVDKARGPVERFTHYTYRTDSLPPDMLPRPGKYPVHKEWVRKAVRYDAVPRPDADTLKQAQKVVADAQNAPGMTAMRWQWIQIGATGRALPPARPIALSTSEQTEAAAVARFRDANLTWALAFLSHASDTPFWQVAIPAWAPALILVPFLVLWVFRRIRGWRRRRANRCAGCGYDLRATTDVCPECGLGIPRRAETGGGL